VQAFIVGLETVDRSPGKPELMRSPSSRLASKTSARRPPQFGVQVSTSGRTSEFQPVKWYGPFAVDTNSLSIALIHARQTIAKLLRGGTYQ
jgi:hypothetical protein